MSFDPYYNYPKVNFTFHNNFSSFNVPPPALKPRISDQEFVGSFEGKIVKNDNARIKKTISISEGRDKLRNIVSLLNGIKDKEKSLSENMTSLSDMEWRSILADIEKDKACINQAMLEINDSYLEMLRKAIAKRTAKRCRLKRLQLERKREKEDAVREREEKSRKIDEHLQKIKDNIHKAKQEEEAKLQADMVLRDVLRKKQDAKKCLVKLDALVSLRRARVNTAKGRGQDVSQSNTVAFNSNIEKLKSLWTLKLSVYEKEESDLRATLKHNSEEQTSLASDVERQAVSNLEKWREILFGTSDAVPQVNFHGDVARFVSVRFQWDQHASGEGSPLPVGWVLPHFKS